MKHPIPVGGREIGLVQGNLQRTRNFCRHRQIFRRSTVPGGVVILPVLHEQALNAQTLSKKQRCGHRRIDPSGQATKHAGILLHEDCTIRCPMLSSGRRTPVW